MLLSFENMNYRNISWSILNFLKSKIILRNISAFWSWYKVLWAIFNCLDSHFQLVTVLYMNVSFFKPVHKGVLCSTVQYNK